MSGKRLRARAQELRERAVLAWAVLRGRDGNLVVHARRELRGQTDEMGRSMSAGLVDMLRVFGAQGYSGCGASIARRWLDKLLAFEPLGPLTGASDEWAEVAPGLFQNKRCGRVFKQADRFGGQAYDTEGIVWREPNGACFTNDDSKVPVTFPYEPATEYRDVPEEGRSMTQKHLVEQDAPAGESARPLGQPVGLPSQCKRLLKECLKPEEVSGPRRDERLRELVRWFVRYADGHANGKWLRGHAFELAYAIASGALNAPNDGRAGAVAFADAQGLDVAFDGARAVIRGRSAVERSELEAAQQADRRPEPWMTSYSVRVGRDKADCVDLVFTRVAAREFCLYVNEAEYLRDLLNAALPVATPLPAAPQGARRPPSTRCSTAEYGSKQ